VCFYESAVTQHKLEYVHVRGQLKEWLTTGVENDYLLQLLFGDEEMIKPPESTILLNNCRPWV